MHPNPLRYLLRVFGAGACFRSACT